MAGTGVLPFIRGLDLTLNNLEDDRFPDAVEDMTSLRWLKLTSTRLKSLPVELEKLQKLEHLTVKKNCVGSLDVNFSQLPCLRTLNLSRNALTSDHVPAGLFENEELTTLDLSHNQLSDVPEGLFKAKSLLVLNLSHNRIEIMPSQLLMATTDLLHLDVSHNDLDALPPQLRRLSNLQVLILSHNPLSHFQVRPLPSLTELRTWHMRQTQRTNTNIPTGLEALVHLSDVDLSENELTKIPEGLLTLSNLKRLNLADNRIVDISADIEKWTQLETLILSRNQIKALPNTLCKLTKIKKLYLNDNQLDFEGIPSGIGKLVLMEIFSAADNQLEMIPESLCRCGHLKKLVLARNKLITLPDAIHLTELDTLDLKGNPDLIMPPKPMEMIRGSGVEFYNIDFSLQHQLRLAGASVPKSLAEEQIQKDPVARKMRLRRKKAESDAESAKVLKGMEDVAKSKNKDSESGGENLNDSIKAKRWDEALEKPPLDYSEFFDEDVGQFPGLTVWEIENFYPNQVDDSLHGKFYEGDCYIVLNTFMDEQGSLNWKIHYWIGEEATLDKRTCSAIHSVNLRNYLGAECRTAREEQADESEEFLELFGTTLEYAKGARTASGFYSVEDVEYTTRTYRIHESQINGIHMEPVQTEVAILDSRFVFLVDAGLNIFVWYGLKCKNTLKSKTRLMAEKINKIERKNKATIQIFSQGTEPLEFWQTLLDDPEALEDAIPEGPPVNNVPDDFQPIIPRLYIVGLGMGYLELPQVEIPGHKMKQEHLQTKNVYLLDCYSDLFVWVGKKSTRLVRAAALKLSSELFAMLLRPEYAMIHRVSEGTESQVFKSKFVGWDDVIGVDFTRTAQSVQRTGADLNKWARQQETKADLSALFTPRQPPMSPQESAAFALEWNEDLEKMEAFVFEGKKFVKLPEEEKGLFHSADSYVYLCRYWVPPEESDDADHDDEDEPEEEDQCVIVYFWQGRDSSNMGWLTFTFSLQKKFEALFGEKLEVVRMQQQQENLKFMSHFANGLIIKQGSRKQTQVPDYKAEPEFYHIRSNGSALCRRCVEIQPDAALLNSNFVYILKVPFDPLDKSGIVYVWIGSKANADEAKVAENIVSSLYDPDRFSVQILNEGEEPNNFFWVGLNGKKAYDKDADFMNYGRLFRCSNEKGYFTVSEKCSDFCQDDLALDDIMILDTGEHVFLWMGPRCSEVEVKLSYKSAQVYIQNLRAKQSERPRKLFLTIMGKESRRFTRCFHGWSHIKAIPR
ncbi:hypothetical protein TCAL_04910 [Tigriopus californicus]|uniref:Gelsolin-like domain-containing protein n=1 Tax=Tigriopus californicus TaxID=6832 RepID=A0A553NC99_TIGCA|nr:protein flightless-1-like [Tigriopus californicus]TRY63076.1 hypothetical protein TCAL_04910 [Tigriopus californicus]|eukprot:TCALIF_04910-PA protein Name:"Similar to fliI Protein flightless-1 (Drosophila melanogaster)" AED:0.00 eAED:0.00 QI:278/1/1/1/1/1/2/232/1248